MMLLPIGIVSNRTAVQHYFVGDAGSDKKVKIVINRRAGRARIRTVNAHANLVGGRVVWTPR